MNQSLLFAFHLSMCLVLVFLIHSLCLMCVCLFFSFVIQHPNISNDARTRRNSSRNDTVFPDRRFPKTNDRRKKESLVG